MSRFSTNSISSTFLTSSVAVSISVNSLRESEIAQGLPKTILLGRFGSKPSEEFLGRIATALRAHVLKESLTDPSATPQTTAHRSMLSMVIRRRGIGNQSIRKRRLIIVTTELSQISVNKTIGPNQVFLLPQKPFHILYRLFCQTSATDPHMTKQSCTAEPTVAVLLVKRTSIRP